MLTSLKLNHEVRELPPLLRVERVAEHLRLSPGSYSYDPLEQLIRMAAATIEERTGHQLFSRVWTAYYDAWPTERPYSMPKQPSHQVQQVRFKRPGFLPHQWEELPHNNNLSESVTYGAVFNPQYPQYWYSVKDYTLPHNPDGRAKLLLPPPEYLPPLATGPGVLAIQFNSIQSAHIPPPLAQAARMLVADAYDGRSEVNPAVESLIASHRISGYAG